MEKEFAGRTGIFTGGASGMALLAAQEFAKRGANVVLADYNIEAAEREAAAIRANGGEASAFQVDVRDWHQVDACAQFAIQKYGKIDYLMNSAGGNSSRMCGDVWNLEDIKYETLEWGINVNLRGAVYFSRAVIRSMKEHNFGVIINMSSVDGVTGSPSSVEYAASKAGLIGMTKSLALYGAKCGIRSVAIAPGPVMTRPAMAKMPTPMGRAAEVIEVVDLILYLCSDKAAYISGTVVSIDGARSCGGNVG